MLSKRYNNDGEEIFGLNEVQLVAKNDIMKKYKNEYEIEFIKCECGQDYYEVLSEKDRYGLEDKTVICKNCGLVYKNPRMTQSSYDKFYNNEYRLLYTQTETATKDFFEDQVYKGQLIFNFIEQLFDENTDFKNKKVLEIGCGAGGILFPFKEKGFCEVGIDLGEGYLAYGKEKGLNLLHTHSKELLKEHSKSFDVIILSHVFEHFLNIKEELDIIKNLLKEDGILYIEVPGVFETHLAYVYDFLLSLQNAHTYYFTLGTLQQILEKNGFELVKGNEVVKSVFKINNKKSYENNFDDKNYVEIKKYLVDLENNRTNYLEMTNPLYSRIIRFINECKDNSVIVEYVNNGNNRALFEMIQNNKKIIGLYSMENKDLGKEFFGYKVIDMGINIDKINLIITHSATVHYELSKMIIYNKAIKRNITYLI